MKTLQLIEINQMNWFDSALTKLILSQVYRFEKVKSCYHYQNLLKKGIKKDIINRGRNLKIVNLDVSLTESEISVFLKIRDKNKEKVEEKTSAKDYFNYYKNSVFYNGYLIEVKR